MPSLEDFYTDPSAEIPEVYAYYEDPSVANARALLAALGIAPPYAGLAAAKRPRAAPSPPRSAPPARRGGAPSADRAVAAAALLAHERADLLHDLHPEDGFVSRVVVQRALRGADAAFARFAGLRERVVAAAATLQKAPAFTYELFGALNAAFGLRFAERPLGARAAARSLHDRVARWRAAPAPTEIVLDGLIFPPPPDDRSVTETQRAQGRANVARSQALCAFLQLLLAEYDPALGAAPAPDAPRGAPPSLAILVGPFQDMDLPGWQKYFARWLEHLKDAAPRLWGQIALAEVSPPLTALSGARIRRRDVVLPNGRVVPFAAPRGRAGSAPRDPAEALKKSFAVSANKTWLRTLFDVYRELAAPQGSPDAPDALAALEPLVDDAIAVNALRDAAKADVAIARGAAYVTYDRLALTYHALRRGADRRGDGFWLHARGVGDAKLGAYE